MSPATVEVFIRSDSKWKYERPSKIITQITFRVWYLDRSIPVDISLSMFMWRDIHHLCIGGSPHMMQQSTSNKYEINLMLYEKMSVPYANFVVQEVVHAYNVADKPEI